MQYKCYLQSVCIACILILKCEATQKFKGGAMKMCPAGGETFTTAWQITCGMRKKRYTSITGGGISKRQVTYRPLSLSEMMEYCCQYSCSFRDLLPYCDPFSGWNA